MNDYNEPLVVLRLRGPDGDVVDIEAMVDTGFAGMLVVPEETVVALGLVHESSGDVVLADGQLHIFHSYDGEVGWGDEWRYAAVWTTGGSTLLGMQLLDGHELRIQVTPGGLVEIFPLA